ncbi:MBL fold metallo-hydrolase [Rhizobium lemnae]|uniref:MBL fold metallo-hydrolase n=1 Tax=Rhizobium lemnae TaxID=1214924 RepID=A0ABV8ECU1_9HYPH|nr:MBL fold metallo-hydrolase [Rhizobium lemnae]
MSAPALTGRFGDYEVILLRDGALQAAVQQIIHLDGQAALDAARKHMPDQNFEMVVNCFVLCGPDGVTLVDAGCGTAWGEKFGKARQALADLGIGRDDVRRVLVTHLHGDHVPGLLDEWQPYFPNAEIIVPEKDLAFFTDETARERVPEARRSGFALAASLLAAYGDRLSTRPEGEIMPGIRSILLPGHTPGHTGYLIGEEQGALLIFADALHIADLQPQDPRIGMVFDLDPERAALSRSSMLEQAADKGWRVVGCHTPVIQTVERRGDAFRLVDP